MMLFMNSLGFRMSFSCAIIISDNSGLPMFLRKIILTTHLTTTVFAEQPLAKSAGLLKNSSARSCLPSSSREHFVFPSPKDLNLRVGPPLAHRLLSRVLAWEVARQIRMGKRRGLILADDSQQVWGRGCRRSFYIDQEEEWKGRIKGQVFVTAL